MSWFYRWPAPTLRTRVTLAILEQWRAEGWTIHRVGQAVYCHDPESQHHLILGCWGKRDQAPAWAGRLGRPSEGYQRRYERCFDEQIWNGRNSDAPWWTLGQLRVYSWERQP
ncbi:MAG: hypothetical protein ABSD62_14685 [Candidatus Limnocylindrales bacterium]|jgi:hypothetical protein